MSTSTPGEIENTVIELKTLLRKFKSEFLMEFIARVRQKTPVITGKLQNGWGGNLKKTAVEIWNTMDYAEYVEYGTHKMAPRGMLRATLEEVEQITEVARKRAGVKD